MTNNTFNATDYQHFLQVYNQLIESMEELFKRYEASHMEFSKIIYDDAMTSIMNDAHFITPYEHQVTMMHEQFKEQIMQLKSFRGMVQLKRIKQMILETT